MHAARFAFSTLGLLLLAADGSAQEGSVFVDIAPCMRLTDSASRHACYDELEATVRAAQVLQSGMDQAPPVPAPDLPDAAARGPDEAPPPPVIDARPASSRAEPASPAANAALQAFGQSSAQARLSERADGSQELIDTVVDLQEREPNRLLITLASGQVWYQDNSARSGLRKGMEVRIYPSPLGGSYRLASSSVNGFMQVSRVK